MYNSPNGTTWFLLGAQTIVMNSCIEMGLVVTNYHPNSTVIATFANVSHTGNGPVQSSPLPGNDYTTTNGQYQPDFSVYPNPTSGELNINLQDYSGRGAQIEIYSFEGKMLKTIRIDEVQESTETIQLDANPGGLYFVKLKSDGLMDVMKRVVLVKDERIWNH